MSDIGANLRRLEGIYFRTESPSLTRTIGVRFAGTFGHGTATQRLAMLLDRAEAASLGATRELSQDGGKNSPCILMDQYRIVNPLDLHTLFTGYRSHDGLAWLFRGQADACWPLLPKAGRPEYCNTRDLGRFNYWRSLAVAYADLPENDWECLAIAQHHGLATRLLDWTLNPLAATFFAIAERPDVDGAVYCFSPSCYIDPTKAQLASFNRVAAYLPRSVNDRIIHQAAAFTAHPDATSTINEQELEPPLSGPNLVCIVVPATVKKAVQMHLEDYGIHYNGLFPDLDGLSRHINSQTARELEKIATRKLSVQ